MGLFNKLLAQRGVQSAREILGAIDTPTFLSKQEWEAIQRGLNHGNEELVQAMNHGSISSNWEHGGRVNPERVTQTVNSMNPSTVSIPKLSGADPMNGFVYHSHPGSLVDKEGVEFPNAMLSQADLGMAVGKYTRGVSALGSNGDFGYAITNPRAPGLEESTWRLAADEGMWNAHPHLPGHGDYTPRRVVDIGTVPETLNEREFAPTIGLGRALKNRGILEQYGLHPGTEAQAARLAEYEPAIQAATAAAEEVLYRWLKNNTNYTSGQVKAVIASLTASGSLIAAASNLANEEAVDA